MDEAFAGLLGYRRVVDDVVIYDHNEAEHAGHVRQFLQQCKDRKIALNKEKCAFSQKEVTFAWWLMGIALTSQLLPLFQGSLFRPIGQTYNPS